MIRDDFECSVRGCNRKQNANIGLETAINFGWLLSGTEMICPIHAGDFDPPTVLELPEDK